MDSMTKKKKIEFHEDVEGLGLRILFMLKGVLDLLLLFLSWDD